MCVIYRISDLGLMTVGVDVIHSPYPLSRLIVFFKVKQLSLPQVYDVL